MSRLCVVALAKGGAPGKSKALIRSILEALNPVCRAAGSITMMPS